MDFRPYATIACAFSDLKFPNSTIEFGFDDLDEFVAAGIEAAFSPLIFIRHVGDPEGIVTIHAPIEILISHRHDALVAAIEYFNINLDCITWESEV
jgi:hypothetical protein